MTFFILTTISFPMLFSLLRAIKSPPGLVGARGLTSRTPRATNRRQKNNERVAILWDLESKPLQNKDTSPSDAARRLRTLASEFGVVSKTVAYGNHSILSRMPPRVTQQRRDRKILDILELRGQIQPPRPYICNFCGKMFKANVKLQEHFQQVHGQQKENRVKLIEEAKGEERENLMNKFSYKIRRYDETAKRFFLSKEGYWLAEELQKVGFLVQTVPDEPQGTCLAIENGIMEAAEEQVRCLFLVSDNSEHVTLLNAARTCNLKVFVIGNKGQTLTRFSSTGFFWHSVISGKAVKKVHLERKIERSRKKILRAITRREFEESYKRLSNRQKEKVLDEMDDEDILGEHDKTENVEDFMLISNNSSSDSGEQSEGIEWYDFQENGSGDEWEKIFKG